MSKFGLLVLLMTVLGSFGRTAVTEIQLLTPTQVRSEINRDGVVILDLNPDRIFARAHLPRAKNASLSRLVESLPTEKSKRLIFYCKNEMCSASHQAAKIAVERGYINVARMPSGIDGWINSGFDIDGAL